MDQIPHQHLDAQATRIRQQLANKRLGPASRPLCRTAPLREFCPDDLGHLQTYRRNLPHWVLADATYFVTFKVQPCHGPALFDGVDCRQPAPADIVEEALWRGVDERYALDGYVIMPDHVHLLIRPISGATLRGVLGWLKGSTGRALNLLHGQSGAFWQSENFDRIVRDAADWHDKLQYIHENPVRAGLVADATEYPWSSLATIHQAEDWLEGE